MLGTRYEEHKKSSDNIPFKLFTNLERPSPNYAFESNWHENIEIQFCIDGEGYVLLDGRTVNISKNDIVVVDSNVLHYTGSNSYIKYSCIILDYDFCLQAGINPSLLSFVPIFKDKVISQVFESICDIYSENDDFCKIAKLQKLLLEILITLREKYTKENKELPTKSNSYKTVKNAIKYIRKNYNSHLSLEEIAKNVFIDKYSLSRNFKKFTGLTVVEYINSYRCNKAAELISEGESIETSALSCGFNNLSFFSKTFKKHMGLLPSQYKKNK